MTAPGGEGAAEHLAEHNPLKNQQDAISALSYEPDFQPSAPRLRRSSSATSAARSRVPASTDDAAALRCNDTDAGGSPGARLPLDDDVDVLVERRQQADTRSSQADLSCLRSLLDR
jgi:hypothetical protein